MSAPVPATCNNPTNVALNTYDTSYFHVNASTATPASLNTTTSQWNLFLPMYAFANSNNFFYKAANTRQFAYTVTFNATRVASVTTLSFHQSKASTIQVSWATIDNNGAVTYASTVSFTFHSCLEH